jgi:hypothetical protein
MAEMRGKFDQDFREGAVRLALHGILTETASG